MVRGLYNRRSRSREVVVAVAVAVAVAAAAVIVVVVELIDSAIYTSLYIYTQGPDPRSGSGYNKNKRELRVSLIINYKDLYIRVERIKLKLNKRFTFKKDKIIIIK